MPSVERGEYPLAIPTPLFRREVPDLLVTLYAAPSFVLGTTFARWRGARVALWVEPTQDAVVARRRWKEALKSRLFRAADGILTTGNDGGTFAARYGARPGRTFVVPHVVDYARYARESAIPDSERRRLGAEWGLHGTTFIYVGRILVEKGLGYLLDAFAALEQSGRDVTLLLVGDGPDEHELRERGRAKGVSSVVFTGFQESDALPALYAAADVFVFPTLGDTFGMVVSEAMACGLPVIATSASGEIRERVSDGENGYVIAPADSTALFDNMSRLADDRVLRRAMGDVSRAKVAGQSPDTWAGAFAEAVDRILRLPRASEGG
jgi:glycosyltransferase involved in cell wall biosynthesis